MPTGDIIQQHKMPESRISSGELKITQSSLHEKGCQLTKVWSDLFSLLSKYQADLMVKENEIEVLEQQLESKQSMLKSTSDNDTREVTNLQGELQAKDLELAKYRADLLNSEEAMNRLQTEMRNNSELLTQCRTEVLENQEKLIKTRNEVDRLRFELTSKDEELRVKDTLLEKLQAQMLKEVSDLTADVNTLKHKLNLEKNAHDETKKTLLSISKQNQRTDVINIPDSPPMLDLSCDATDEFNMPNVTKSNESGFIHSTKTHSRLLPSGTTSTPSHSQYHPYQRKSNFSMASATKSQADALSHASNTFGAQNTQPSWTSTTSSSALSRQPEQNESDVFSALSADNSKESAAFKTEASDSVLVSLSGPLSSESFDDSSQSLGMDSSQSAFWYSQGLNPFKSMMYGKFSPQKLAQGLIPPQPNTDLKAGPTFSCQVCGQTFKRPYRLKRHSLIHTGERPHVCEVCGKSFARLDKLRRHSLIHIGVRPFSCPSCDKSFTRKDELTRHLVKHSEERPYKCGLCHASYLRSDALTRHITSMHSSLFVHQHSTTKSSTSQPANNALLSLAQNMKDKMSNESPQKEGSITPGVPNEQTSPTSMASAASIIKQNQSPEFQRILTKYHQAGAQLMGSAFSPPGSGLIDNTSSHSPSDSRDTLAYSQAEMRPLATKYHQGASDMPPLFQPSISKPLGGIESPSLKADASLATKYHLAAAQMFQQNKLQNNTGKMSESHGSLATKYHQAGAEMMSAVGLFPPSMVDKLQSMSSDSSPESEPDMSAEFSLADVQSMTTKYHQAAAQIMGGAFPQSEPLPQDKITCSSPVDSTMATKYRQAGGQPMNAIFPGNEMQDMNANPTHRNEQQTPLSYSLAGMQQMMPKYQQASLMSPAFPQTVSPDVNRNSTIGQPCEQQPFSQTGEVQQ
ncbi:uncharacterized protein LOC135487573 [Lineus longissimus]|uniref:uncharacterized protein LOC135487573 n=1 Tax=Lineus longissimus TaxID=88925 RepID=UPI00315D5E64